MSSSQNSASSSDRSRKRKQPDAHSSDAKRPRLDEGTSHPRRIKETIQQMVKSVMKQMGNTGDTYHYAPLREIHGQEIRVLVIEPGKGDDPIKCRLVPSALPNTVQTGEKQTKAYDYTALSYYWGEGPPIHEITVTSYTTRSKPFKELSIDEDVANVFRNQKSASKTGTLHVRSNLYAALQRFRRKKRTRTVWIDALCIDQNNAHERSAQVQKMHELYIQAKKVCIWLGDGSSARAPDPQQCFDFLRSILDLKKADKLLDNIPNSNFSEWHKILDLMRNKWFSRRWVIQELALARSAEVLFGNQCMPWSDFADAIAIFILNYEKIRPGLKKAVAVTANYVSDLLPFDGVTVLGANTLVDFTNNLFRRGKNGEIQQRMQSLENLVSNLLAFEASDPRDTIYAVLSLANDTHGGIVDPRLQPDYKHKCLLDVYVDFIEYCVEKSGSLDILFRYWALTEKRQQLECNMDALPTWIPLVGNSAWGSAQQRIQGRHNGDSFVETSFRQSQGSYCASSNLQPDYKFMRVRINSRKSNEKSNGILSVKGIRIGTIKELAPRAAEGMIFVEALQLAGFDLELWQQDKRWSASESRVPEGFWRTLVADRGPNGLNPPSWYARACLESLNHLRTNGDLRPDDVIDLQEAPLMVKDFLERVKSILWGRQFMQVALAADFQNKKSTTYGLAPQRAKAGDIICVLFGCSVPVVLKKQTKDDETYFTMTGECYVYGMMNGEAVNGTSFDLESAEHFELR